MTPVLLLAAMMMGGPDTPERPDRFPECSPAVQPGKLCIWPAANMALRLDYAPIRDREPRQRRAVWFFIDEQRPYPVDVRAHSFFFLRVVAPAGQLCDVNYSPSDFEQLGFYQSFAWPGACEP